MYKYVIHYFFNKKVVVVKIYKIIIVFNVINIYIRGIDYKSLISKIFF